MSDDHWLASMSPNPLVPILVGLFGMALIAYAGYEIVRAVHLASEVGLHAHVLRSYGKGGRGSYPVHFLFMFPIVYAAVGAYLVYSAIICYRINGPEEDVPLLDSEHK